MTNPTSLRKRHKKPINRKSKNPRENCSIFSRVLFSWTVPLFLKSRNRILNANDIYQTLNEHKSDKLGNRIENVWSEEIERNGENSSLIRTIWMIFKWRIMLCGFILFVHEMVFRFVPPIFLSGLISYYWNTEAHDVRESYFYGGAVIIFNALSVLNQHSFTLSLFNLGLKIRLSITNLLYRKILRLSTSALRSNQSAQIMNLLSEDVAKLDWSILYFHYLWVAPLQLVLVATFINLKFGLYALIGILVIIVMIPIQKWLSKEMSLSYLNIASKKDSRINLTKQIIDGIEVIKMYAWENVFIQKLKSLRSHEIKAMRKGDYFYAIINSLPMFVTRVAVFVSLTAYVLFGQILTAEKAYVIVAYFGILNFSLTMNLSQAYVRLAESRAVLQRLQKFLVSEEFCNEIIEIPSNDADIHDGNITVKNVSVKYDPQSTFKTLDDISFNIEKGMLVAVTGPVGSGKTSLLHAILGELPVISGDIKKYGKVSYSSQEPWLFCGTIKDNIIFGEEYNECRYNEVLRVCDLNRDLDEFPIYRDETKITNDGKPLSGGQRARVILARAVYREASIYLLDDPLSAVDARVASHIYNECILKFLSKKTVVLVTHQKHLLRNIDLNIEIIDGGKSKISTYQNKVVNNEINHVFDGTSSPDLEDVETDTKHHSGEHILSTSTSRRISQKLNDFTIYWRYLSSGIKWFGIYLVFGLCIIAQLVAIGGERFLASWVETLETSINSQNSSYCIDRESITMWQNIKSLFVGSLDDHNIAHENKFYSFLHDNSMNLLIYTAWITATVIFSISFGIIFFENSLKISKNIHNAMTLGITRARMMFFNEHQTGAIIHRFSKDMKEVDERIPKIFIDVIQIILSFILTSMNISLSRPILLIPSLVLLILFYILRDYYINTSKGLKRLDIESREPITSQLNETLKGLHTIRALKAQKRLINRFEKKLDLHSSAYYMLLATRSAFEFAIDFLCVFYIACIIIVFWTQSTANSDTGDIGFSITQAMSLISVITYGIRQSAQLETDMIAVQRCLEYKDLEREGELGVDYKTPIKNDWPRNGRMSFHDYSLFYSNDMKYPSLKSISNLMILPGEKIGIVGRTGAGKSTIINALCRFAYNKGEIRIDDVDIHSIGLHELRSKITIIPQTPVLFTGTIRFNLDPSEKFSDQELWDALKLANFENTVNSYPGKLNHFISPNDISIGQKQLLCLARAILRKNRIVILDEVTANIDFETDRIIQQAIKSVMSDATVLIIAHRLHTIIDCDRVLVMYNGEVKHFDTPYNLLSDPYSNEFQILAKETNDFENLLELATIACNKKINEERCDINKCNALFIGGI